MVFCFCISQTFYGRKREYFVFDFFRCYQSTFFSLKYNTIRYVEDLDSNFFFCCHLFEHIKYIFPNWGIEKNTTSLKLHGRYLRQTM